MTSNFDKIYNKIIFEQIAVRDEKLPEKAQKYKTTKKWQMEQQYIKQYMHKVFEICKQLCYDYFQEYFDYLEAIFQDCQLNFSCSSATVDLYGELLPNGNIDFNLYPTLEIAMLNKNVNLIKRIVNYQDIFSTIPHEMAHIVDIMINGRPTSKEEIHRQSWHQIFNMLMQYFKEVII